MTQELITESLLEKFKGFAGDVHIRIEPGNDDPSQAYFSLEVSNLNGRHQRPIIELPSHHREFFRDERGKTLKKIHLEFIDRDEKHAFSPAMSIDAVRTENGWNFKVQRDDGSIQVEDAQKIRPIFSGRWEVTKADLSYSNPERFIGTGDSALARKAN